MWEFLQPASYASAAASRAASRIRVDAQQALKQIQKTQARSARWPQAIALIGLADDLGVRMNHGRAGAAQGPIAIRQAMCTYGVVDPEGIAWPTLVDVGDVIPAEGSGEAALLATHDRIRTVVTQVMQAGCFPLGLGGGHDLTLAVMSAAAAFVRTQHGAKTIGGIYVDPHLDVRPTVGSGMPFRRLMEDHAIAPLVNIGWNRLANATDHVQYFRRGGTLDTHKAAQLDTPGAAAIASGNRLLSVDEAAECLASSQAGLQGALRTGLFHMLHQPDRFFLSIDLDVLDSAVMPAVSAINPSGLGVKDVEAIIEHVCCDDRLIACDIMEFAPRFDEGGRGARVAAHLVWRLIAGLSHRFEAASRQGA